MTKVLKHNALLIAGLLGVAAFFLMGSKGDLTGPDARALVKSGARLLDVRSPEEFAGGHLEGALNLPHQSLTGAEAVLAAKKNEDLVVYCQSGRRSAIAVKTLREAGFTKVHDLGAMRNW